MASVLNVASSSYWAVKRQVDRFDRWEPWIRLRRGVQAPFFCFPDTGLFGLTPLKMHVLVCGFPNAGTTLLQLMLENGLPNAKRFGRERAGWRAATYSRRNHELMISKQPQDLLRLDWLRDFYAKRSAALKIILVLRDPRDLLTTQRNREGRTFYSCPSERWLPSYHAFLREREQPDTIVVRYEDLISDPAAEQRKLEMFLDRRMQVPFDQFLSVERPDFDTSTLCGLRPIEPSRIGRWQRPEQFERMQEVCQQIPDLPTMLQTLGYTGDDSWADDFALTSEPAAH